MQYSAKLLGLCALLFALPAHAQYYGGGMETYGLWEPQSCAISSSSQAERDACYGEDASDVVTAPIVPSPPPMASPTSLIFTPKASVREASYQKFLPPDVRAEFRQRYGTNDIIAYLTKDFERMGLSSNNVADAMAVWAMSANAIIKGQKNFMPDKATAEAVRSRFALGVLQSPRASNLNDAEKQAFSEQMILFAIAYELGLAARDTVPVAYEAAVEAAKKHARQMGLDFDTMILVPGEGFRKVASNSASQNPAGSPLADSEKTARNQSDKDRARVGLEEYLANMKRMGREPDPRVIAIFKGEEYE